MIHIQNDKNFTSKEEKAPNIFKFIDLGVSGSTRLSGEIHCRKEKVAYL